MISNDKFEIRRFDFNPTITEEIRDLNFANNLWPIVYLLSEGNEKIAYVGETADATSRMSVHLKNDQKKKLKEAHLIESHFFNKSATLDIESNLIKYISGDGKYKLLNANLGLANHNYYQKESLYWRIFASIWDNLRSLGVARHSIEHINNSDLFKYSPYKSLSMEQLKGLTLIIDTLINGSSNSIVMKGGAGTGKTILAIFLFKLIVTDLSDFSYKDLGMDSGEELMKKVELLKRAYPNPSIALVVPMSSFRETLKKVFTKVKGLKGSMVVGPTEITKRKYDIVVVDEAHRLRRRVNLGAYYGAFDTANKKLGLNKEKGTELDWMRKQSKCAIYFYDEDQSVKPSDVERDDFAKIMNRSDTKVEQLSSQFRVRGGNGYVRFIQDLLNVSKSEHFFSANDRYEFKLINSMPEFVDKIRNKDKEVGLSRMIAGYSWPWISKKKPDLYDIEIDGVRLRWNNTNSDWINSDNAVNEVGCIHTTQGYDLNYAGIIFGHEIGFDKDRNEIVVREENYFDKNGKQSIKSSKELKGFILNIYKTILMRGIRGTFIYVCDPGLKSYLASRLNSELAKDKEEELTELIPYVNSVPLYNLNAAAGSFSELQKIDDYEWIEVPNYVKVSEDFFACKVIGESMNRIIPNGSICLFRKYNGGSRNGKIVLVQSIEIQDVDMGVGFTVKQYSSKKSKNNFNWIHDSIILTPMSYDDSYQDIVLDAEGHDSFQVIGIFDQVLG